MVRDTHGALHRADRPVRAGGASSGGLATPIGEVDGHDHLRSVAPLLRARGVELGAERRATCRIVVVTRRSTREPAAVTPRNEAAMTRVYARDALLGGLPHV